MDFVMTSIAFFIFDIFRFHELTDIKILSSEMWSYLGSTKIILEQIFAPIIMMGIYVLSGYYNNPFTKSRLTEFFDTFFAALFNSLLIYLVLLINDTSGARTLDYMLIIVSFLLLFIFTFFGRWFLTTITIRHLKRGDWIFSILIIGNSSKSRQIYKRLKNAKSVKAYDVAGFIRIPGEQDMNDGMPVWDLEDIPEVVKEYKVDQLIIAPYNRDDNVVMNLLEQLFPLGHPVKIVPDTLSFITSNIKLNDILGVPLVDLTAPRIGEFQKNIKRMFDVIISLLALIILSPLMIWTAVKVKLSSPGPIIYRQERIGKSQKKFTIYKFRSMRCDAEAGGPQLSSETDPRITKFGHFMRKYRIDEFPQFWNVLKGDMSLVGPRPERKFFIHQIVQQAPYYGLVFQVRPGITSWGMVKYGYASSVNEMVERSRYDLIYINNMSIATDIKILIYTVRTVLKGSGM